VLRTDAEVSTNGAHLQADRSEDLLYYVALAEDDGFEGVGDVDGLGLVVFFLAQQLQHLDAGCRVDDGLQVLVPLAPDVLALLVPLAQVGIASNHLSDVLFSQPVVGQHLRRAASTLTYDCQ